jgi:hypothetical protein
MRLAVAALLVPALVAADKDQKIRGKGSNDIVEITASPILNRDALKAQFGTDFGGYYIFMDVTVTPKMGEMSVTRDDFLLRTDRDGERTKPFVPSQIAGPGVLIISQRGGGGAIMGDERGPVWGGYPGSGDRPRRMGGDGGAIGNSSEASAQATVQSADKNRKEDPVMKVLEQKMLPERKTADAVAGMLYFPLEIKQKVKDLELIYTSTAGKISVRFK